MELVRLDAEIGDVEMLGRNADADQVAAGRVGDRQERRAAVQQPERDRLQQPGRQRPEAAELLDVHPLVHVVDERDPRLAQPQRGEEGDAVDHLEHDVRVPADPAAQDRPGGAQEDGAPRAHAVHGEQRTELLAAMCARIFPRDDRHPVPPGHPAGDLAVEVRAGPAPLWMGPVAVGEHQDVPRPRAGCAH